ncbi:MAG: pyridoxal-phosphate dependent enzyme [Thermoanaerobaculia bacterium]|nr:pyridoxal-phosphate dependent enzyme [Thermoanaerobaculia bacterium]
MGGRLQIERIRAAAERIDPVFLDSPQGPAADLGRHLGVRLVVKDETRNPVRCFKGRGSEALVSIHRDDRPILCASAGNFGQAMAYSCSRRGVAITVYASVNASAIKLERMRELGAVVVEHGEDFDAAKDEARRAAAASGARFVEDSLDVETVEGAGTMALELAGLDEDVDAILVPLGNGAMFNGIACVLRELRPAIERIAVQARGAPAMIESWRGGRAIEGGPVTTIADGIAVRVPVLQALADMDGLADDGVLVSEDSILEAMRVIYRHAGRVVEPSSAVGVAALIETPERFAGRTVATVLCGANVSAAQLQQWLPEAAG